MSERHVQLLLFVTEIADESFDYFLLSLATERRVAVLRTKLSELNEVVIKLCEHDCAVRKARA